MKKLHRSTNDMKLAGVCSGLGEYFDLDPVLFRVAFIGLVTFGGMGLLAYLVMCLLVPMEAAVHEADAPKRMRRSRSDCKIAGVCGGLGEFIDVDPVLFRVLFIVLAFVGGLGILFYLVLWIAMPQASATGTSTSDHAPAAS